MTCTDVRCARGKECPRPGQAAPWGGAERAAAAHGSCCALGPESQDFQGGGTVWGRELPQGEEHRGPGPRRRPPAALVASPPGHRSSRKPTRRLRRREMKAFFSCMAWRASRGLSSNSTQLCLTLCDPMDHSTPGFPVLHDLLEFAHPSASSHGSPWLHAAVPCMLPPRGTWPGTLGNFPGCL